MPETVVFEAFKPSPPTFPEEFALLEESYCDDELVYDATRTRSTAPMQADASSSSAAGSAPISARPKVNAGRKGFPSSISTSATSTYRLCATSGKRSLTFEGLAQHCYCLFLADSGASHSFISKDFCESNKIQFAPREDTATLANGSTTPIIGTISSLWVKLGPFRANHTFLVVDMPQFNAVLGMDFMSQHRVSLHARERQMRLFYNGSTVALHAHVEESLPDFQSDFIELCTFQQFANEAKALPDDELNDAFLAYLKPEFLAAGTGNVPGASDPDIQKILAEFSDVLVSEIPGGLPPERFAADGSPIEHTIETAPDADPFSRPPRPFTVEEHDAVKKYLADFIAKGWIRPSLSPWAAPVLFVPKKADPVTGKRSLRMVISFVKLNSKTLNRIAYRLPRISDLLNRMLGARYFSKLDLLDGYYQVRMKSEDIPKTAFTTPYGNFEFRVMPMGLCGAASTFQYLMDETFRKSAELKPGEIVSFLRFIANYLDDVCIFSRTREEHLMHIRAVLQRLRKCKLYVKPTKCEWLQTHVDFLGHNVSADGLAIHPDKGRALQHWPAPQNVSEVRSLLGTFGFWRSYIKTYADIAAPLTELTSSRTVWRWGEKEQAALDKLKHAVLDAPVLMHPDTDKPFFVVTDASNFAVGASLEQESAPEKRRPITFFSHSLNNAERGYPVHERELLAIVLALRVWRHYLYGSAFKVICQTDHKPLQHFMSQSTLSARQVRWQQFLSEFNLQVKYIPGDTNDFADGLSRRPDLRLMFIGAIAPFDGWLSRIQKAILQNKESRILFNKARQGRVKVSRSSHYALHNDTLYYVRGKVHAVYVPPQGELRRSLLSEYHDSPLAGHFGWEKSFHAIAQHYYWPSMRQEMKDYVLRCTKCQLNKPTVQPKPQLHPLPVPEGPFHTITLDWLKGFPKNKDGYDSVLNIVDKFSKWAIIVPCDSHASTKDTIRVLWERVFSWVGLPNVIIGDRDSRLTASMMQSLRKFLQVELRLSSGYHPQTDGQTENFHRIFLTSLRSYVSEYHGDWMQRIPAFLYAYHNTIHSATGYTPHRLLFGWCPRDLRAPLAADVKSPHADVRQWLRSRTEELAQAHVSLEHARSVMNRAHKASDRAHVYHVDDLVKLSTKVVDVVSTSTQAPKLQPKYIGPFRVIAVGEHGTVTLDLPDAYSRIHNVFNVCDVRPWLHDGTSEIDVTYPALKPQSSFNPVVQVLDRKRAAGRAPSRLTSLLDIPTQYLVVRHDGSMEWLHQNRLQEPEDRRLVKRFERRFKRTDALKCASVKKYNNRFDDDEEDDDSDDEVDVLWENTLHERFGPD